MSKSGFTNNPLNVQVAEPTPEDIEQGIMRVTYTYPTEFIVVRIVIDKDSIKFLTDDGVVWH